MAYSSVHTDPLSFYDEPNKLTNQTSPMEEKSSDKSSDVSVMSPSPMEQFDLDEPSDEPLPQATDEYTVPQRPEATVLSDNVRHTLNRRPFDNNGRLVIMDSQMNDLVASLNVTVEATNGGIPQRSSAAINLTANDCSRGYVNFSPNHSVEALTEDMEWDQST